MVKQQCKWCTDQGAVTFALNGRTKLRQSGDDAPRSGRSALTSQPLMLDENLPTFYIKPSTERPKHQSTYYFCQGGEDPSPAYSVRHLDPDLPASKNRYAVALYDSFCPDILYGEVLLIPKWTQPSLSQEAIRQNNGVPPPPEPILPNEFIIQLYNPDQQVLVRYKPKSWNSPASWQFEMPQQTFRLPSGSSLDRTMSDPAASDITPKLRFNWQKDGKFSKDLTCYLSGKTVDVDDARKRSKEPDITVKSWYNRSLFAENNKWKPKSVYPGSDPP
ncbi:hypothetical protein CIHG_01386 [Coccidioides immitis H538.4]|uniref:Uncharacterized protein n=1 Tax=Coccidioides immitis H538.4 TaxID=396776 RepID=A0A0J8U945_COCIT|nr:hypothetical protein CIHG_01386 [Coccidioides immitis H538.4]